MSRGGKALCQPAHIASVCVLGEPACGRADNAGKAVIVTEAVDAIVAAGWCNLDAVVFPGGTFWLPTHIGHLAGSVRRRVIERAAFSTVLVDAARRLAVSSRDVAVVAGLRSPATAVGASGDQLAVAWRSHGVVGIGRKVWPSDADTADPHDFFLPWVGDYGSRRRLLRLPSGCTAVLCACYDMFGVAESPKLPTMRTGYIRFLLDHRGICPEGHPRFLKQRGKAVAAWHRLVRSGGVSVGLATVHGFQRPGREVYWQRHGVASASAALGGGLALAAAHFGSGLPGAASGTLAAANVPRRHLNAGLRRWGWPLEPVAAITGERWLARLFTWNG